MQQFRLFKRKNGLFFIENISTRKQSSLRTRDKVEAHRLLSARNEAHREPMVCLQMARAYNLRPSHEYLPTCGHRCACNRNR